MRQRRANRVAVTLRGSGVDVTGEIGHLHEVIELIGDQRHERMTQLVGRPVRTETRALAQLSERRRMFDIVNGVSLRVQNTKPSSLKRPRSRCSSR